MSASKCPYNPFPFMFLCHAKTHDSKLAEYVCVVLTSKEQCGVTKGAILLDQLLALYLRLNDQGIQQTYRNSHGFSIYKKLLLTIVVNVISTEWSHV